MGCGGDGEMGWEAWAMGWEATWGGRCGRLRATWGGRRAERQQITHHVFVFLSFFFGAEKICFPLTDLRTHQFLRHDSLIGPCQDN
jgi:hypothetical protein